jgi:hypothetical protein
MSVQLILYPQSYEGVFNAFSGNPYEAIVNGISFTDLDNTGTYTSTSGTPYVDTITNATPTSVNTWYRYRVGASAFPTVTLADLVLNSLGNGSSEPTGIYQKMSNLTIGQQYTVTINISTQAANGFLANRFFDGLTPQGSISTFSTATSTITKNFFATNTEMTYMLAYYSTVAEDLTISSMSVLPINSTIADPILSDGQVILDLYEDEDLPLTLSVDNFKNVAEKVQSYSKAFNLPATKRNNKIFNQIFEITRNDDRVIFSPYKKSECVLKQDGFVLFKGYLRLLDVTDKDGEISYNVNLYSEVIALADYLKELSFRDLVFTELEHDYNYSEIRNSWQGTLSYTNPSTSGFRTGGTVRYPFVDWNHQFTLGTSGNPVLPNLESAFRPFIKIKYLIERIFENTPFTFSSDFFDTTEFEKLYMDFNWGADNVPFDYDDTGEAFIDTIQVGTLSFVAIQTNDNTFDGQMNYSGGTYTALQDNQTYNIDYSYAYNVTFDVAWSGTFRWKMVKGGQTSFINATTVTGTGIIGIGLSNFAAIFGNLSEILNVGDTLTPEFKSDTAATNDFNLLVMGNTTNNIFGTLGTTYAGTSGTGTTNQTILQTLRGELGQWDFLKGLMTMFNLVTIPDENNPNNIKFEPYVDVFINNTAGTSLANRTIEHDWTDKIDVSEMKLEPLADLNRRTIFKFVEDDDDYAFNQYKRDVGGHLYGSKKFNATDEFNILDGLDEVIAEPFAATVVKPLMDNFPEFITPALYSMGEDGVSEGFENSPRIMYNNGVVDMASTTYSVPAQNGSLASAFEFQFLQFSHLSDIPTITSVPPAITDTRDFHFGECQLMTGVGAATVNNLFNLYWLPYYNELYNPNTRTMTIKVNLSPSDINTFKFNDTVFIKNRVFRVNKIDYKPNDLATVEFILIP